MYVVRLFQAAGPATLNASSPNFSDVYGTSETLLSADHRLGCLAVTGSSSSASYLCDWAINDRGTSRHCSHPVTFSSDPEDSIDESDNIYECDEWKAQKISSAEEAELAENVGE